MLNKKKNIWFKKGFVLLISFLFISIIFNTNTIGKTHDQEIKRFLKTNNLFVGGTGLNNYSKIQDAINNSTDGGIIYVFNGVYQENILINKSIKLIGENIENTIIDGVCNNCVVVVLSNNVVLENFTIRNSGGYNLNSGIKVSSNNNLIKNCFLFRTKTGILLDNSNSNKVSNCYFYSNGEGIFCNSSYKSEVLLCIFSHNSIGVSAKNTSDFVLNFSCFKTNGISFLFNDSANIKIENCNISNNSINLGGVFLVASFNISINNCIFKHNGAGVNIFSSNFIKIENCDFIANTHFAISLRTASKNVSISNCKIKDNFRHGLYIEVKNQCDITFCNILNNTLYGILSKSTHCIARNNWWGSIFGPSYTELRPSDKISIFMSILSFFPWKFKACDNIGAKLKKIFYCLNITYQNEIQIEGEDTDEDGIPNWWEEKWGYDPNLWEDHKKLDPDNDSLNNFEECFTDEYGSNPYQKDLFLEIDWMESINSNISNKPSQELIDKVISIFKEQEINLHVDLGKLDGGEEIPSCTISCTFAELKDIYWYFFLKNDINNPRKGIFHYGLICNYCPDSNFPFFGWDQLDSFAISAQLIKEKNPLYGVERLIAGAIVHHLGHTLGLIADTYGGIDNIVTLYPFSKQWWKYRNYKSCMNYYYKYRIFSYSDGSHGIGDFNDWENIDFSFFKNCSF